MLRLQLLPLLVFFPAAAAVRSGGLAGFQHHPHPHPVRRLPPAASTSKAPSSKAPSSKAASSKAACSLPELSAEVRRAISSSSVRVEEALSLMDLEMAKDQSAELEAISPHDPALPYSTPP